MCTSAWDVRHGHDETCHIRAVGIRVGVGGKGVRVTKLLAHSNELLLALVKKAWRVAKVGTSLEELLGNLLLRLLGEFSNVTDSCVVRHVGDGDGGSLIGNLMGKRSQ